MLNVEYDDDATQDVQSCKFSYIFREEGKGRGALEEGGGVRENE